MSISILIMAAVLVEAMTGIVKSILVSLGLKLQDWADQAISLVFAMALAIAGKIDFLAVLSQVVQVSFQFPALLGMILSGLVMSRGSNAIHDLLKKLNPQLEQKRLW